MSRQLRRKSVVKKPENIELSRDSLGGGKVDTVDGGLFDLRIPCYVGMDASLTHFGIAAVNEKGRYFTWVFVTKKQTPATTPFQIRRLLDIGVFVYNTLHTLKIQTGGVSKVALEGYAYGAKNQREAIGEGTGIAKVQLVKAFGWAEEIAYPIIIPSRNVKQFATGGGQAEKSDMKLAVYKKWGVEFKDDNAADAFTLAKMAESLYSGVTQYEYETRALEKIERHYPEWQSMKMKKSTPLMKNPNPKKLLGKSMKMKKELSEYQEKPTRRRLHRR